MDRRIEELLHLEIDGRATVEQLAELQALVASSAESKTYREDLMQMQKVLASSKEVEPPAELRQQILAGVAAVQPPWSLDETRGRTASNPQAASRGHRLGQRFLDSLREGLRPREAFAFGLGAAACLLIVFLAGWDRFQAIGFPENALPGSMIPIETSESLQAIDRQVVEADGLRGMGVVARAGDLLYVTLQIETVGRSKHRNRIRARSPGGTGRCPGCGRAPSGSRPGRWQHWNPAPRQCRLHHDIRRAPVSPLRDSHSHPESRPEAGDQAPDTRIGPTFQKQGCSSGIDAAHSAFRKNAIRR